jgi:hypothetical protein
MKQTCFASFGVGGKRVNEERVVSDLEVEEQK